MGGEGKQAVEYQAGERDRTIQQRSNRPSFTAVQRGTRQHIVKPGILPDVENAARAPSYGYEQPDGPLDREGELL